LADERQKADIGARQLDVGNLRCRAMCPKGSRPQLAFRDRRLGDPVHLGDAIEKETADDVAGDTAFLKLVGNREFADYETSIENRRI
jgi:hypothetical protein